MHCLDSILAQSYTNFEAILVNDGSMDKSGEIATQYAQKDSRLTLVYQDNQGLSNARNTALRVIKDKELSHMQSGAMRDSIESPCASESHLKSYIVFVDSDDYIDGEMLLRLYEQLGDGEAYMIINNSLYHVRDEEFHLKEAFIPPYSRLFDGVYTPEEILSDLYIFISQLSLWSRIAAIFYLPRSVSLSQAFIMRMCCL